MSATQRRPPRQGRNLHPNPSTCDGGLMATTDPIYVTKDAIAQRSIANSNDTGGWTGTDRHLAIGTKWDGDKRFRSFMYFPISFADMREISAATIYIRSDDVNPVGENRHCDNTLSSATDIYIVRMLKDFGEGF